MFESIINNIENIEELERISEGDLHKLLRNYPNLPCDYTNFLINVGFGDLGELQLYDSPIIPKYIYKDREGLDDIIIIGDDFQGYCFGYDLNDNYRLVEISPVGDIYSGDESDFISLLKRYFV